MKRKKGENRKIRRRKEKGRQAGRWGKENRDKKEGGWK